MKGKHGNMPHIKIYGLCFLTSAYSKHYILEKPLCTVKIVSINWRQTLKNAIWQVHATPGIRFHTSIVIMTKKYLNDDHELNFIQPLFASSYFTIIEHTTGLLDPSTVDPERKSSKQRSTSQSANISPSLTCVSRGEGRCLYIWDTVPE